jgi:hypothetical protein
MAFDSNGGGNKVISKIFKDSVGLTFNRPIPKEDHWLGILPLPLQYKREVALRGSK